MKLCSQQRYQAGYQTQQCHFHIDLADSNVLFSYTMWAIAICIAYGHARFELNVNLLDSILMHFSCGQTYSYSIYCLWKHSMRLKHITHQ